MRTLLTILILALAPTATAATYGPYATTAETDIRNTVTGQVITIHASLTCEMWPATVGVRCGDLYRQNRPLVPSRLAGRCVGADLYWLDLWDGSVDSNGKSLGVRVYWNGQDCREFVQGRTYIVTGRSVRAGQVYATEVRE